MSSEPSQTPPTSLPAAGFDATGDRLASYISEAAGYMSRLGIFGIAWLDDDLSVETKFGPLVDFVAVGRPITESILAFIGLEADIAALRNNPERLIELPAIAVALKDGAAKRLNFTLSWQPNAQRVIMLAYRANSQTELEIELSRQIRARLIAEAEISAKSRELTRANADLESFAAIVSHDLKAPLRHMRHIADDVMVSIGNRAGGDIDDKLRELQSLSRRMAYMLTELFDYASLGRKYEAVARLDTRALVESIVGSVPEGAADIRILGSWPTISTLAAPLDLVIRNLVQNAIQHHDHAGGRVDITCEDAPDDLFISIEDDGPGIPPAEHAAIFLPFRTLGRNGASEGTGMGLAMVKKTVETAGGVISIASDPARARGARFTVRWPKFIKT